MGTRIIIVIFSCVSLFACKTQHSMIDKSTVKELDIKQYLGTWYELARFDHSFEKNLVGVTATYSLKEDGKIKVLNQGYKNSLGGERSEAIGKAKFARNGNPAHLKVSFFWIFYADYLVLDLDKDYQWAIVGSKSDNYLWILSRTPQISTEHYKSLIDKVEKRGYDISQLIKVKQKID